MIKTRTYLTLGSENVTCFPLNYVDFSDLADVFLILIMHFDNFFIIYVISHLKHV